MYSFISEMSFKRFYGTLKHTSDIPGDGSLSDDESLDKSDSDDDYLPPNTKNREDIISDSEDEASQSDADYVSDTSAAEIDDKPSTSSKWLKNQKGKATKKTKSYKKNGKATEKLKGRKKEKEVTITWKEEKLKEFDEEL